jgi:hypothetical protein
MKIVNLTRIIERNCIHERITTLKKLAYTINNVSIPDWWLGSYITAYTKIRKIVLTILLVIFVTAAEYYVGFYRVVPVNISKLQVKPV